MYFTCSTRAGPNYMRGGGGKSKVRLCVSVYFTWEILLTVMSQTCGEMLLKWCYLQFVVYYINLLHMSSSVMSNLMEICCHTVGFTLSAQRGHRDLVETV